MADTVTVRRGGSYLTIPASAVDRYKAKGYDAVDERGNIIDASVPNDINILKKAYEEHIAEIKRLKEEIVILKEASVVKKPEPSKSKLFGTEVEEPEVEEVATEKKTAKRSKKSV